MGGKLYLQKPFFMKKIILHATVLFSLTFFACQKNSELKPELIENLSLKGAKEFLGTQLTEVEFKQLNWSKAISYKKQGEIRVFAIPNKNSLEKKSAYVFFEGNNISGNWVSFEIDISISLKYKKIVSESFNGIRVGVVDINEKGNVQAINIYENGLLSNQIAYRTSSLMSLPASIRGPNLTVLLLAQLLGVGQPDWNSSLLVDENQFEYLELDPQGGSGGSYEIYLDILFDYSNSVPAIDLQKYFNCFDRIPDNGATYSIKLCADLPDNSNPDIVVVGVTPGHAFLTITKTNGSQSVTQSFGFYPQSGPLSIFAGAVGSKIVDDGKAGFEHEVNASI